MEFEKNACAGDAGEKLHCALSKKFRNRSRGSLAGKIPRIPRKRAEIFARQRLKVRGMRSSILRTITRITRTFSRAETSLVHAPGVVRTESRMSFLPDSIFVRVRGAETLE